MKLKYFIVFFGVFFWLTTIVSQKNASSAPEFVIIIPSYNNEKFVKRNLDSVFAQQETYEHYEVIYIDDCSSDATSSLVDQYAQEHSGVGFKVIHNAERQGATKNWYDVIHALPAHKIVVCVDGDDALANNTVLLILAKVYKNPKIWMTYGNYLCVPNIAPSICAPLPRKIIEKKLFRTYRFISSHLRTFYAGLFQRIKKNDFMYKNQFMPVCCDVAMMIPMLEMSAKGHIKYIPEILYHYTASNPLSEFRVRKNLIQEVHSYLMHQQVYPSLDSLPIKK